MYVGSGDHFELAANARVSGHQHFTLAFIIAGKDGQPAWDGVTPMGAGGYAGQIEALRALGGDVIVSFGGEAGQEVALTIADPAALAAAYRAVVDRYQFTWLDFDIEGKALSRMEANERRNTALARLQAERPGLRVSFTLPVDPDGISEESRRLLADARKQGVRVAVVNLMIMDYGSSFSRGKTMLAVSVASAVRAEEQCRAIDPGLTIGLTQMIGQNDEAGEVFTPEDARGLIAWAAERPGVGLVSFWSINRDAGKPGKNGNTHSGIAQAPWAYTRIFQKFERPASP